MTTLAYNHKDKEIAMDSRATSDRLIITDKFNKLKVKDGVKFIGCGMVADLDILVDCYPHGLQSSLTLEAQAFIIDDGKVFMGSVVGGEFIIDSVEHDTTLGSGAPFALAAMDFGASAKDAVKYAMKRDSGTGGRVKVVKV